MTKPKTNHPWKKPFITRVDSSERDYQKYINEGIDDTRRRLKGIRFERYLLGKLS